MDECPDDDDNNNNNQQNKQNTMRQKYWTQRQIASADFASNLTRQQTTRYQHAQYWQRTVYKNT